MFYRDGEIVGGGSLADISSDLDCDEIVVNSSDVSRVMGAHLFTCCRWGTFLTRNLKSDDNVADRRHPGPR